jgi:hypothetical protein
MPNRNWKPNPNIVEQIKRAANQFPAELPETGRVNVDNKIRTWADIVKEIEAGTKFGRRFYNAYLKALKRR